MMTRRAFLKTTIKATAAYAALRAADYGIGAAEDLPEIPFADDLVDTLLFLKSKTRLVCLGDTNHKHPELNLFLSSHLHMERLGTGGYENVFLESGISHQEVISKIQNQEKLTLSYGENIKPSSWLTGSKNDRIQKRYSNTLYGLHKPRFHAADTRDGSPDVSISANCMFIVGDLLHSLLLPFSTSQGPWLVPGLLVEMLGQDQGGRLDKFSLDDTKTAARVIEVMNESSDAGLVVFGQGHFRGNGEAIGVQSMHQSFVEADLNPLRVDLHYSAEERAKNIQAAEKDLGDDFRPADIDFVVSPSGKKPELVFNNTALEKDYRRYTKTPQRGPVMLSSHKGEHNPIPA